MLKFSTLCVFIDFWRKHTPCGMGDVSDRNWLFGSLTPSTSTAIWLRCGNLLYNRNGPPGFVLSFFLSSILYMGKCIQYSICVVFFLLLSYRSDESGSNFLIFHLTFCRFCLFSTATNELSRSGIYPDPWRWGFAVSNIDMRATASYHRCSWYSLLCLV